MADPKIQNFSTAAGDETEIDFDVGPDEGASLDGATILWQAFEQEHGVPKADVDPVISKTNGSGIEIVDNEDLTFNLTLLESDTIGLLGNYYHEVTITDDEGKRTTPTVGIMTITQTENRD